MGIANCTNCNCNGKETEAEFDLKSDGKQRSLDESRPAFTSARYSSNIRKIEPLIIKLQAV